MRKREFRPTLDGRLEDRVVPAGHKAVVLTTNAYSNALSQIDLAVNEFNQTRPNMATVPALYQSLRDAAGTIPYGRKSLYPALVQTVANYGNAGQLEKLAEALNGVVKNYIEINTKNGVIRYLQSATHNVTDGDIPTSGHVPKGGKK